MEFVIKAHNVITTLYNKNIKIMRIFNQYITPQKKIKKCRYRRKKDERKKILNV